MILAPSRSRPIEPWVRVVGHSIDVRYNRSTAPIDPRPWAVGRVRRLLASFRPEVLHVHEPFTPSTSMWATLFARGPVVATFHAGPDRSRLSDLAAPALRRLARRISVRLAVSERAARFARAHVGGEFRVVPNGIDVARFAEATPAELGPGHAILFVGRLDERKGFPVAVEAFGILASDRPDLRLVVVGDGRDREAVDRLEPAIRERVAMLGAVPNDELPRYHAACDALIVPSLGGESFGIVLVEGMAAGLPIVASRIPGYDEVITDGVEGFLVPPSEPEALAAATARLLDDPALAQGMREAGRERARRFDWSVVVEEVEDAYREAVAPIP